MINDSLLFEITFPWRKTFTSLQIILNFDLFDAFTRILVILVIIGWVIMWDLLAKVFIEPIIVAYQKNGFNFALLCLVTAPKIIIILFQNIKLSLLFI